MKQETLKRKKPMLATLGDKPFNNSEWIFETKFDGYRALALLNGKGKVDLYSRNLKSFNKKFSSIAKELNKIKTPALLDGEIVIEDRFGRSQFQLLQEYQRSGEGVLHYHVFDLLHIDTYDTTDLKVLERKELLEKLLKKSRLNSIFYSNHVRELGEKQFSIARRKKLEGIMAKRIDSTYQPGKRSTDWLKLKISREQEVVIAGFTDPQRSRKYFGSILLGAYENGRLIYIGKCGTGFNEEMLRSLYKKMKSLASKTSPFSDEVGLRQTIHWIKPELVCEVKFTEWTKDGSMRHPAFLGLRMDKKAKEVKREMSERERKLLNKK